MPDYTTTLTADDIETDAGRLDFSEIPTNADLVIAEDATLTGTLDHDEGALRVRAEEGTNPTLTVPAEYNEFLIDHNGDAFEWTGIDFDVDEGVTGFRGTPATLHVEDVTFHGRGTYDTTEVTNCFSVGVSDPDGVGIIRNVNAPKGSAWAHYKSGSGRSFAWVSTDHRGELRFENCEASEFGNNAIYGSAAPGTIIADNCEFWNNNVAAFRAGADGSKISNSVVGIDPERYTGPRSLEGQSFYQRGVWVESKRNALDSPGYVTVENTDITIRNPPTSGAAIQVRPNACGLRVHQCDIQTEDVPALHAKTPATTGPDDRRHAAPDPPHDVRVTASKLIADGGVDAVDVSGRALDVRDCCVQASGEARGVRCRDATGAVTRGRVVGGTPAEGVTAEGILTEGDCADWSPGDAFPAPEKTPDPTAGFDPATDATDAASRHLPTMKLTVKTDADDDADDNGKMGYRLPLAEKSDASVDDQPHGDTVENNAISGTVWPSGGDGYQLHGEIESVETSGSGAAEGYALLDGERVAIEDLPEATAERVAGELGDALGEKVNNLSDEATMRVVGGVVSAFGESLTSRSGGDSGNE